MRQTDLHASAAQIRDAFEDLQTAWLDVAAHWNDGVSQAFCQNHLEPLGPIVKLALDSTTRMATTVAKMHHDCAE